MKRVYQIQTYAIYATGDYCIMMTIAHNQTTRDIKEICENVIEDAIIDEDSNFIKDWF